MKKAKHCQDQKYSFIYQNYLWCACLW